VTREVQAAGGVVTRRNSAGAIEVLVVHRPKYDDWSLPKGKLDPGESFEDGARREVWEETGLRCDLGTELPSHRYVDQKGRDKLVRYWMMTPVEQTPWSANAEVDALRWVSAGEAQGVLTYDADRRLVAGAIGGPE
jgi:8-oxo-dGTP diphosphatase